MSRRSELLREIAALARQSFGWQGRVAPEMRLIEDLRLDSLKALELMVEIENRFCIRIDETAESELLTVGDLVRLIESQEKVGSGPG